MTCPEWVVQSRIGPRRGLLLVQLASSLAPNHTEKRETRSNLSRVILRFVPHSAHGAQLRGVLAVVESPVLEQP